MLRASVFVFECFVFETTVENRDNVYSNMTRSLSGHISIFGLVFFLLKSLYSGNIILRQ